MGYITSTEVVSLVKAPLEKAFSGSGYLLEDEAKLRQEYDGGAPGRSTSWHQAFNKVVQCAYDPKTLPAVKQLGQVGPYPRYR